MPSPDHINGALPSVGPKEFWSLFFLQLKHRYMNIWWGKSNPKIALFQVRMIIGFWFGLYY